MGPGSYLNSAAWLLSGLLPNSSTHAEAQGPSCFVASRKTTLITKVHIYGSVMYSSTGNIINAGTLYAWLSGQGGLHRKSQDVVLIRTTTFTGQRSELERIPRERQIWASHGDVSLRTTHSCK